MVEETWNNRDLPILKAIVEAMQEHPGSDATLQEIQDRSGLSQQDVIGAMTNLAVADSPFFDGRTIEELDYPYAVQRLRERALSATGVWPDPESFMRSLIESLLSAAETEPDPERKGKLRQAAETLGGIGLQIGIAWAAGAIPH